MLAGLRLDGFVGGDDEEEQIDSAHPCQHVLDEAFVARNIDKAQAQFRRQFEVGEPQIDGDAAALFFLQAVGVDPRQRLDQRRLAVIDVSRRPDDDVLHGLVTVKECCPGFCQPCLPFWSRARWSTALSPSSPPCVTAPCGPRHCAPASPSASSNRWPESMRGWKKIYARFSSRTTRSSKFSLPCASPATRRLP